MAIYVVRYPRAGHTDYDQRARGAFRRVEDQAEESQWAEPQEEDEVHRQPPRAVNQSSQRACALGLTRPRRRPFGKVETINFVY